MDDQLAKILVLIFILVVFSMVVDPGAVQSPYNGF
jgi:hypothetical protein